MSTTEQNTSSRRLAAILFADIVGYTAMMQSDEGQAMSRLQRYQEVLKSEVNNHKGELIKNYGDGSLCLFNSVLDAVNCAKTIQKRLQKDPKVPLRIGVHLGDVMYRDDDIYGNAVNVSSRIESMGVPGSVLMSKNVYDKVKNQSAFSFESYGSFEFKNVEEPLEVFALASDGLVVPKREQMKGKTKAPMSSNKKWIFPTAIGALLLALFAFWQMNSNNGLSLDDSLSLEPTSTISQDLRDKRVAVMVFENQTMDTDLDAFGKMISDWVTRGLMETGEANVISAANIQNQIALAGVGSGANPKLAASTGVDMMLQGRYYKQENQIIVHANIMNIHTGEVIHALEAVDGSKSDLVSLLDELTQEVLGYWAVKKQKRFLQNPPKYEAWKKYREALDIYGLAQFDETENLLLESYRLDSTFYAPLLKLHPLYNNFRKWRKQDSLVNFILSKNPTFTEWEKLRFESLIERDQLKSAQIHEKRYKMDPSDQTANYMAAFMYNRANYPKKSIEILNDFDKRYLSPDTEISWREAQLVAAYIKLGDFDKAVAAAENYRAPKMFVFTALPHLSALVQMDSVEACFKQLETYNQKGTYHPTGKLMEENYLLERVCRFLYMEGDQQPLIKAVNLLKEWAAKNVDHEDYYETMGYAAFMLGNYEEAVNWWKKEKNQQKEKSSSFTSRLAVAYVKSGDMTKANTLLKELETSDEVGINYDKAKIYAAMGQRENAIEQLKLALGKAPFWGGRRHDIFLKPLFGNPEFEEMVKPKG